MIKANYGRTYSKGYMAGRRSMQNVCNFLIDEREKLKKEIESLRNSKGHTNEEICVYVNGVPFRRGVWNNGPRKTTASY